MFLRFFLRYKFRVRIENYRDPKRNRIRLGWGIANFAVFFFFLKAGNESAIITDFIFTLVDRISVNCTDSIRLILHVFHDYKMFQRGTSYLVRPSLNTGLALRLRHNQTYFASWMAISSTGFFISARISSSSLRVSVRRSLSRSFSI